jgi:beta-galactosidase
VYYLGCTPDEDTLKRVLDTVIGEANIEKTESPDGVEIARRGEGSGAVKMIINHNSRTTEFNGETLAPFECRIIPEKS